MSETKFQTGDRVENTKIKRVGFIKKKRGDHTYLVSIQGFGEREWDEADIVKADDPKGKRPYDRSA